MVGPKELLTRHSETEKRNSYREKAKTAANLNLWSISLCWFFPDTFFLTLRLYNVSSPFLHHWQRKIYLKEKNISRKELILHWIEFHYYGVWLWPSSWDRGWFCCVPVWGCGSEVAFGVWGSDLSPAPALLDPGNQVTRVRARVRRSTREMPPAAN